MGNHAHALRRCNQPRWGSAVCKIVLRSRDSLLFQCSADRDAHWAAKVEEIQHLGLLWLLSHLMMQLLLVDGFVFCMRSR